MLKPQTESDLEEVIRSASGPLRITGGGTRPIGNPVTGDVLSLSAMSGIELYEPGALTLVAKAGTPIAEVTAALKAENQRLAFEPMDHGSLLGTEGASTIGGVVAANVSGPRRIQAGACRDSLIGVRFVDGSGAAIKNGGRVMKNVTGYDLVKLMAGSYGTLGVLSEVSFKVLPGIDATATLVFSDIDFATTAILFSTAMGAPYEVSGAARLSQGGQVLLRLEGFTDSVQYRTTQLSDLLSKIAPSTIITDPVENEALWKRVANVDDLADTQGDVWRISVKPTDMPSVTQALSGCTFQLDWAGGLIWALAPEGHDLRKALTGIAGHATLIRAQTGTKERLGVFHPEPAPIVALSQGLRAKFDPRGILNPGLMG